MTTWTAPQAQRVPEPKTGPERAILQGLLDWHRQTLLGKCAGLTAEQLKTAGIPPSNLTLLGLVRHLTLVEQSWIARATGTEEKWIYGSDEHPDGDFEDLAGADAEANLETYAAQVLEGDAMIAGLSLDHEFTNQQGTRSVRWLYLHLIEEYARHNGHADLLRERIDGATGD